MQCCAPNLSFWENQNAQAAVIIQVESLKGINNLNDILTACGKHIDSVWLRNLDCRVSMSLPGFWGEEPEWISALETLRVSLTKHNKTILGTCAWWWWVAQIERGREGADVYIFWSYCTTRNGRWTTQCEEVVPLEGFFDKSGSIAWLCRRVVT
jgi:hypothetical protein